MDILEKFKEMVEKRTKNEMQMQTIMELSTKKLELQKSIREIESSIDIKQCELDTLKNKVIALECEIPLLQEKERLAYDYLKQLVKQVVEQDDKINERQKYLWTTINDWVTRSCNTIQKDIPIGNVSDNCAELEEKLRNERIEQIKLEGQLQAASAFEKYQCKKIAEIKGFVDKL